MEIEDLVERIKRVYGEATFEKGFGVFQGELYLSFVLLHHFRFK
ncbi:MAG: hypothetical protein ACXQTT_03785 [Candidatus Syntropharchaeia archaeon]